jgi:hypothetical protein
VSHFYNFFSARQHIRRFATRRARGLGRRVLDFSGGFRFIREPPFLSARGVELSGGCL